MNKKIIIIAAIFIILSIVILGVEFWVLKSRPANNDILNLPGTNNQVVTTNNFVRSAPIKYDRSVVLYVDSTLSIQYDNVKNGFQISLISNDIATLNQLRTTGENILLSKLNISKADACKLDIIEKIPDDGSLSLSTYTYRLSFCTSNDNFPK